MDLSGKQYKQLSALINKKFNKNELERLLRFYMGINIDNISMDDSYETVVFHVIGDSQRKGWTFKLLESMRDVLPEDDQILAFSQNFGLAPQNTPTRTNLERLISTSNSFLDIAKWRQNLGRIERQVCAIELKGEHAGTGFLLGADVIMTNYHVINDVINNNGYTSNDVKIRFDFKESEDGTSISKGKVYDLAEEWLITHSPYSQVDLLSLDEKSSVPAVDELDFALLRVANNPGGEPFGDPNAPKPFKRGWLKIAPDPHDFLSSPALFIVQHPMGKPLKLALDSESVLDMNGNKTRVIYRTNTEPGSSGSPCFDQDWKLVALHHSGDPSMMPTWNEGIPFSAIMALLKEQGLDSVLDKASDSSILDEL